MSFEQEFQAHVIDYFCDEYLRGRTPHPCLACNDKIKFDFLMKKAAALDIDYIATGHYARLDASAGRIRLLKGVDTTNGPVLRAVQPAAAPGGAPPAPVGWHSKAAIRDIARAGGLPVADKPDSQEICSFPRTTTAPSWPSDSLPLRARSLTSPARCWDTTRACRDSPWARGVAWAYTARSRCSS